MTKYYILILYAFAFNHTFGQCTFERFFEYYTVRSSKVMPLKDGGYLSFAAAYSDTNDINAQRLVLIKTDACGNIVWINDSGYLGNTADEYHAIEMDSGYIMVEGYTYIGRTTRVGKYNKNGQLAKEIRFPLFTDNFIDGLIKNPSTNTYILHGANYSMAAETYKPIMVELDENLNILRRKEFQINEISDTITLDKCGLYSIQYVSNKYYTLFGPWDNRGNSQVWLVELDSTWNIQKAKNIRIDSIPSFGIFQLMVNQPKTAFEFLGRSDDSYYMGRMDFDGNINKLELLNLEIKTIEAMSQTSDGGYIMGPYNIVKIDSTFKIEWQKPLRGYIYNVAQLPDNTYICGGWSDEREDFHPGMYLVKIDQYGNFIKSGLEDANQSHHFSFKLYPNPSNKIITIESSLTNGYIQLLNAFGLLVHNEEISNSTFSIDVSSLNNGFYFVRLIDEQGIIVQTKKISVLH